MYIAYSSVQVITPQPKNNNAQNQNLELQLRYQAYQTICNKYRREIAAIQQYLPGWQPSPPAL